MFITQYKSIYFNIGSLVLALIYYDMSVYLVLVHVWLMAQPNLYKPIFAKS